jgi:hypothetical protein
MACHAPSYSIYPSLFGSSPSSRSLWFPFWNFQWQSVSWHSLYMSHHKSISRQINKSTEQSPSGEVIVAQLLKKFSTLMGAEDSLPFSQKHATGPCVESDASSPHCFPIFFKIYFNITLRFFSEMFSSLQVFRLKNFVRSSHFIHTRYTPTYLILHLISVIIYDEVVELLIII